MTNSYALYKNLEKAGILTLTALSEDEMIKYQAIDEHDLPEDILTEIDSEGIRRYFRYPLISDQKLNMKLNTYSAVNIVKIKKWMIIVTILAVITLVLSIYVLIAINRLSLYI